MKPKEQQGLVGPLKPAYGPLRARYGCPPFSVLDQTDGAWQKRKKQWLGLGIQSEVGRDENLLALDHLGQGTSVFDPVLCELAYNWWSPKGGIVLDPFAGGSVRGITASVLDRKYIGCELRQVQVEANRRQAETIHGQWKPKWKCGDSLQLLPKAPVQADFMFTCPPYGDLEEYSKDPADISSMDYEQFADSYRQIMRAACSKLRHNRFACVVVSNYRDKRKGRLRDLVSLTREACEEADALFYNDAVLKGSAGSAAVRANRIFDNGARKLVKMHQNVLVFCKGDPKRAAETIQSSEEK